MTKKIIIGLLIFTVSGGILFSQEIDTLNAEAQKLNTVALHASLLSIGLAFNYERHLNNHLSIIGDTSFSTIPPTFTLAVKGRLYPFGRVFYLEMGAGYGMTVGYIGLFTELLIRSLTFGFLGVGQDIVLQGVVLTPALGWNIKLGKQGNFKLPIGLGMDFFIGKREFDAPFDIVPNVRIGFGYSF